MVQKKIADCALWGKSFKLGTVIVQVVATILAMDHTQICAGEEHCALGGRGHGFFFGPEKTQTREKSGMKNFEIPIFLTVAQDKPYKIPVTYFFKRFYENI